MTRIVLLIALAGLLLAACVAPAGPVSPAVAPDAAPQAVSPEVVVYRAPT